MMVTSARRATSSGLGAFGTRMVTKATKTDGPDAVTSIATPTVAAPIAATSALPPTTEKSPSGRSARADLIVNSRNVVFIVLEEGCVLLVAHKLANL
jgi:hypothetical protein